MNPANGRSEKRGESTNPTRMSGDSGSTSPFLVRERFIRTSSLSKVRSTGAAIYLRVAGSCRSPSAASCPAYRCGGRIRSPSPQASRRSQGPVRVAGACRARARHWCPAPESPTRARGREGVQQVAQALGRVQPAGAGAKRRVVLYNIAVGTTMARVYRERFQASLRPEGCVLGRNAPNQAGGLPGARGSADIRGFPPTSRPEASRRTGRPGN